MKHLSAHLVLRGCAMDLPINRFKRAIRARWNQLGIWSSVASNISREVLAGAGWTAADCLMAERVHVGQTRP